MVWIANRDKPMFSDDKDTFLMNGYGKLILDESGNLKVIDYVTNMTLLSIYISNSNEVGSGKGNTRAVLEDSGNFVLYDNISQVLWQSFDHPFITLLPGMKLGYNLTTQQNWNLTSALKDFVPASGTFVMSLEHIDWSTQIVIRKHGKVYWTSGSWIDGRLGFGNLTFESTNLSGSLVDDASGMYFEIHKKTGIKTMIQLSSLGELIAGTDRLTSISCYGDARNGCISQTLPICRDMNDSFQVEAGGFWVGQMIHRADNSSISISDCMDTCWNDCNCRGFSTTYGTTGGCYTWGADANFSPESDRKTAPQNNGVLLSQKPLKKKSQKASKTWVWVVLAISLSSVFAVFLCYMMRVRSLRLKETTSRDNYIHELTSSDSFNYGDELEKGIKDAPDVKIFSLKAISVATHNFSNNNKLGEGGYGPVYKGILFDGRQIAVKRLSKTSLQGIEEFKNELILISKLQHTNLVRLYGCCIHQEEKMLIYEFMPNKSLDFFLFAKDEKKTIDWQMRFNIIEGVAQGLLYLHKYSRMRVIHRDLKVSNVLLDENMNPKIADFGMARIFQRNVTEATTNRVVGTYGYMAPEYAMRGIFSVKSDVFSFGVLILEIVSGKKTSRFYSLDGGLNLLEYAWELWKRKTLSELTDESLGESCDINQLLRTIHVGLLCVQENADDRPTIPEIISMLNNEIVNLPNPKQPAYFTGTPLLEATDNLLDKSIPASINGLTITRMEAR